MTRSEFDRLFKEEQAKLPQIGGNDAEGNRPWSKAIESDALAVHPDQIKEVMDRNAAQGLHIDYNPVDGRPILKDRDQRKRLLQIESRAMGQKIVDHDGGYSD